MNETTRTKRLGFFLVAALVLATLAGHVVTRTLPEDGADFAVPEENLPVRLSGRLDRTAVLEGGDGRVMMELALRAQEARGELLPRAATDFLVVLDRSGSMSGEKLRTACSAVAELISQLGPGDRLALVTFESGAEVLIPFAAATEEARTEWRKKVAAIPAGGGTNMLLGLEYALELLEGNPSPSARRMLLLSDGQTSPNGLTERATRAARSEAVLTTIGIGAGFNEFLMSSLADAGTGNFYYLEEQALGNQTELAAIFRQELAASRETVARAVAVEIEPGAGVTVADVAGYPLEHAADGTVTFRPGSLFAGQERRVWVTFTAEGDAPTLELGRVRATYVRDGAPYTVAMPELPKLERVRERQELLQRVDRAAWERSVVEEDYSRLRQRLAGFVQNGQRDEALQEIDAYRNEKAAWNAELQSAEVDKNLADVEALEARVEDAFSGAHQRQKQNLLSKVEQLRSWDARRAGSKKAKP